MPTDNNQKSPRRGIYPAVVTPFREDTFDGPALASNLEAYCQTDLAGFVLLGSNGETRAFDSAEKSELLAVAQDFAGAGRTLIGGVAEESTALALKRIESLAAASFDFALALPPFFFASRMDQNALRDFFSAVADSSALPILLYNAPQFSAGVTISPGLARELSLHANIIGIKDSAVSGPASYLAALEDVKGFSVFAGSAGNIMSSLMLGGTGAILAVANIVPELSCQCAQLCEKGDLPAARQVQLKLIRLNNEIIGRYGTGGLKAAANLRGLSTGIPRPPLPQCSEEEIEVIRSILQREGIAGKLGGR